MKERKRNLIRWMKEKINGNLVDINSTISAIKYKCKWTKYSK